MTNEDNHTGVPDPGRHEDRIKILIIEDSPNINLLYERGLPDTLFEKRFATNGKDGLMIYHQWQPDIIVLDVMLPVVSGFMLLKTIRLKIRDTATTVIISTSLSGKEDVTSLVRLGIQGYIVKPFAMRKIGGQILQYFEKVQPDRARKALTAYDETIATLIKSPADFKNPEKDTGDDKWLQLQPDFFIEEFTGSLTVEGFCRVIEQDHYDLTLQSEDNTLARINEMLQIPDLYEKIRKTKHSAVIPAELKKLLTDWHTYRNADYARMTITAQKKIRILNRLLLQAVYPGQLPGMSGRST